MAIVGLTWSCADSLASTRTACNDVFLSHLTRVGNTLERVGAGHPHTIAIPRGLVMYHVDLFLVDAAAYGRAEHGLARRGLIEHLHTEGVA